MKRVCIVRQKYYPAQRNLRRNAETLVKEGCEVDVVCVGAKGQKKHETVNGVNVNRVYFLYHRNSVFWYFFDYTAFFILVSLKLAQLSIRKRHDVIEVCNVPDFLVFATLFPKLLGSKVIFNMFEKTEQLFADSFGLSYKHIFTRFVDLVTRISAGYADSIIVTDIVLYKKVVERYGIPSQKVTLVLNVVDESVFNLEPDLVAGDGNHFQLVVVSSLLKRYGIQTLIQTVPLLLKDIPELKIDIVGDGEYRPHLEQMARDLRVEGYLNFTGFIPYEEVPSYIAQASVCVAPMIDDVGTPNKIFEYFALGKATVSSDLPGLKALFDDRYLLYFQPGNAEELAERIQELYRRPDKRAALGNLAQEIYRKNRWSNMKRRYLDIYDKLYSSISDKKSKGDRGK